MGASWSKKIPQPSLVQGNTGRGKVVFQRQRLHTSKIGPYGIEITCPSEITGISCTPFEKSKIQSPEATVKSGGINYKYVRIYLEPTEKGEWAYEIAISAEENHVSKASQQVRIE